MNVRDNEVKKPTQDQQEPSTKPTPESHTTPVPDNQTDSDNAHRGASRSVKLHLWFKRWRDTWVPLVNVGIGFLALVVVAFQSCIYNDQRKLMDAQNQFIQSQAQSMQEQTQIMEKSFGLSEKSVRAHVGVATLDAKLKEGQVSLALGNFGNVPATAINLDVTVYRATPSSGVGGQSELKNPVVSKELWDAGAVSLFPGNSRMSVVIPLHNFSQEEGKAILAKKRVLYVGGVIQYKDRNGNDDSTPFAYEYNPPPNETWIANSKLSKFFNKN